MTKNTTTALGEPSPPSAAEFERGRQEVQRELDAAQTKFNQAAFECSTDRSNLVKRKSFEEAERDVSRLKAELGALSGAKQHAAKQEHLAGLERVLTDLDRQRAESHAAVAAVGPAFDALKDAIKQLGISYRALQDAEALAQYHEGECFVPRGGLQYPILSVKTHGLVEALLAFELWEAHFNLVPAAFRFNDAGTFEPEFTNELLAKQMDRATTEITRYIGIRADAVREQLDSERNPSPPHAA